MTLFTLSCVLTVDLICFILFFQIYRLPTIQQEVQQRKLLYMGLYLLIWGEAANLRFMPECLCYIYHHVCFKVLLVYNLQKTCTYAFFFFFLEVRCFLLRRLSIYLEENKIACVFSSFPSRVIDII